MGEHNSPTFRQGLEDGQRDADLIGSCPPGIACGPDPPIPGYPYMYLRGYHRIFDQAVPHTCTDRCDWRQRELRRIEQQRRGGR